MKPSVTRALKALADTLACFAALIGGLLLFALGPLAAVLSAGAGADTIDYHDDGSRTVVHDGLATGERYYRGLLEHEAAEHGLEPALLRALIKQESGFNPMATSTAGAVGLGQLMPKTAERLGVHDLNDPWANACGSARYLAELIDHHGRLDHALAAYNAGEDAVEHYKGIPPYRETQTFVRNVLRDYRQNRGDTP